MGHFAYTGAGLSPTRLPDRGRNLLGRPVLVRVAPAQARDAEHAGRNQEGVGADPGGGRGEAGRGIAQGGDEEIGHAHAGRHLQHTGQDGEDAVAHPLDGEADDIHQGQGDAEGAVDQDILAGQGTQQFQLRLLGIQEQHGTLAGEEHHGEQDGPGADHPQQGAGADPLAQPPQLQGPHVLAAVGGHGGSHGVKGAAEQLKQLASRRHRRHIGAAQAVDRSLEHDGADGGDGVLKPHGHPHDAQVAAGIRIQPPLLPGHPEDGVLLPHIGQAGHAGDPLGHHRGDGRPRHPGVEPQNKGKVQEDVQHRGQGQEVHRCPAVPQRADDPRQQVVEEGGGDAHKDDEDIDVCAVEDVRRRLHHRENGPAQQTRGHREHQGEQGGEIGGVGHVAAHANRVVGPHPLRHGNGKSVAHPHAEADHQKADGAGGAHRRQGARAQQLAHDHGVHQVIELLEQHAQQRGQPKAENQPHGAAGRQILHHKEHLASRRRGRTSAVPNNGLL